MRVAAPFLAAVLLAVPVAAAAQNRPTCQQVIREVNREVNDHHGRHASPLAVARTLGTDEEWVLRCMQAHGRKPARQTRRSDDDREAFERALEEGRPVMTSDENAELRYDKAQELRLERRERRERQKAMEEHRKFYESDDPFFRDFEY
jgi:hypothetical protein